MADEETEARIGILNLDQEIKARQALANILRYSGTVVKHGYIMEITKRDLLTGEKSSLVRMAEHVWDRHLTVAEGNLIHMIWGRFSGKDRRRVNA